MPLFLFSRRAVEEKEDAVAGVVRRIEGAFLCDVMLRGNLNEFDGRKIDRKIEEFIVGCVG